MISEFVIVVIAVAGAVAVQIQRNMITGKYAQDLRKDDRYGKQKYQL